MADPARGDVEADMDLLAQHSRSRPIQIRPVRHQKGRAWHWQAAIETARVGCTACRPDIRCWQHDHPPFELVGYRGGTPALDPRCFGCMRGQAGHSAGPSGGVLAVTDDGAMFASLCQRCTSDLLGPIAQEPAAITEAGEVDE